MLKNMKIKRSMGITLALGLVLLILPNYQNCSMGGSSNTLSSQASNCLPTQTFLNGQCVNSPGVGGVALSISNPTTGSTLSLQSAISVSGVCAYDLNPTLTIYLLTLSGQILQQSSTKCVLGGSGTFSVTIPFIGGSNQAVPAAGSYTIGVFESTTQGNAATKVTVAFSGGQRAPTITGPNSISTSQTAGFQSMEQTYSLNGGGPAQLVGTCDSASTQTVNLIRSGLGPYSDNSVVTAGGNNCGSPLSVTDPNVPAPNTNTGYDNYTYWFQALDVNRGSILSNKVDVYVRPLPKDLNNDDIILIMNALYNLLGRQVPGINSFPKLLPQNSPLPPAPMDSIFGALSGFSGIYASPCGLGSISSANFGVVQAACAMVESTSNCSIKGADASKVVGTALLGTVSNDAQSFNPADYNNQVWQNVQSIVRGPSMSGRYLPPQLNSAGSILAIAPTLCP
jgi:hypothetical protein